MFQQVMIFFICIVGSLSLFISFARMFVRAKQIENNNLSALFFFLAVLLFQYCFIFNETVFNYPQLLIFHLTINTLLGPLLYFAYFFASHDGIRPSKIMLLLFLPSIIMLIPDIIFIVKPFEEKIIILKYIYQDVPLKYGFIFKLLFIIPGIQTSIFLIILLINKMIPAWKSDKSNKIKIFTTIGTNISILIGLLIIIGYATGSFFYLKTALIGTCLGIIIIFILSRRYPEFLRLSLDKRVKNRYQHSMLNKIDADMVSKNLIDLMEKEKVFADEDFSLQRLAYELSITPHQLSQFLNEKLNSNFNAYINQYRAEEAKKMLVDEPERSIKSIAIAVGFNSKSVFYKSFLQLTGQTPCKFRKETLSGKKVLIQSAKN